MRPTKHGPRLLAPLSHLGFGKSPIGIAEGEEKGGVAYLLKDFVPQSSRIVIGKS